MDHCFVLVEDSTSRKQAYTAMSRGRLSNELYLDGSDARLDESHATELQPDELDRLRRDLGRSIGQELAIDQLEPELAYAAPELEIDDGLSW